MSTTFGVGFFAFLRSYSGLVSALWRFGVSLYLKNVISNVIRIVDHAPADLANGQLPTGQMAKMAQVWGKCSWCNAKTTTKTTNKPNEIKGNCKCKWNTKLPSHVGHLEEFYLFINNEKHQLRHAQTKYKTFFGFFSQKCVNCLNESHLNCAN